MMNWPRWMSWSTAHRQNERFHHADLPEWFEWTAYNARSLMGHTVPNSANELDYLQREPVGVIALITPWNYHY